VPGEVLDRGKGGADPEVVGVCGRAGLPVRKMITPEPRSSMWRAAALAVLNWAFKTVFAGSMNSSTGRSTAALPWRTRRRAELSLTLAQNAVVARGGLDREAGSFEPANELAHVLSHPFSCLFRADGIKRKTACLDSSAATASSEEFAVASK
jgi:hypothetical protein